MVKTMQNLDNKWMEDERDRPKSKHHLARILVEQVEQKVHNLIMAENIVVMRDELERGDIQSLKSSIRMVETKVSQELEFRLKNLVEDYIK